MTDITEIPAKDGKFYVSAIFDCYNPGVLGLAMADNMRAELCVLTIENAHKAFPGISGAVIHSDRGSQYTSEQYRATLKQYGIIQSMNSDGGRCHDNARCESMWARMKEELLYGRYDTKKMTISEQKTLIWRYFIIYWNNDVYARQTAVCLRWSGGNGIMTHGVGLLKSSVKKKCKRILTILVYGHL